MGHGVTVGSELLSEVPFLNCTLETLSDRDRLYVDKLTNLEVSWSNTVADWQEILWCDLEFSQSILGWKVMLQVVANLRFLHLLHLCLTNTKLNRVDAVFLHSLHLRDLASVELNNSTWLERTPFVPEVCATDFVAKRTDTSAFSVRCFGRLDLKLSVNLLLKAFKCLHLVGLAKLSGPGDSLVVQTALLGEGQVSVACLFELSNRLWFGHDLSREHSQLGGEEGLHGAEVLQ